MDDLPLRVDRTRLCSHRAHESDVRQRHAFCSDGLYNVAPSRWAGGFVGPHLRLFEARGRVHIEIRGRTLPLRGAGMAGVALADIGLPSKVLRSVVLLARSRAARPPR